MVAIWIAGALLLGLAAWRIGLPPLIGFLASGFVFGSLGMEPSAVLGELSHAGVLLLLFAVGLKLRVKTLVQTEVWGTAVLHLFATGVAGALALRWTLGLPWASSALIA
ncbi:MAG TPA: cation:proton antiporter, partial [Gammaproteobacteria bacterium]|nr:cation:proton antiporter [Gammaproteobacteria bacterium]